MSIRILIADDDPVVHESLGLYLDNEYYEHDSVYDGLEAERMAREKNYDLIVLDIMMPQKSGTEVCRDIRRVSNVPIIMLTAKGEEIDRILGLELGADDYIVKPFSPREVVARIKAILRRMTEPQKNVGQHISFPGLDINLDTYQVKVNDEIVPFTPKEVEILYLLASHTGQVMDREQILDKVWGYDYYGGSRTIDTHIKRIRQKIQTSEDTAYALITVYGVGYKFEVSKL
ncbi:MAG: response regulator transcription factor [Fastidiosipilaceae bacterium]|jgi:two-component system response regulator ResD|nr:response regulator transcription factor [Clostridiaceae bacterium]